MRYLLQAANPEITDNKVLDEWRIPFGDWIEQAVFWVDNEASTVLDVIKWPFDFLTTWVVDKGLANPGFSWVWFVLIAFVIATVLRTVRVGAFTAVALTFCGLLGNQYWEQTAKTIGFVLVAVILCVLVGIPIGIASGRVDAVWKVVRPVLDAMQVVHSFVYMLPFIYFFGIGEESATMVTMVFALPPLIRLTNLGIRQVPADVVEASRAFGAAEWRVLTDVQLPLARPAIMTGLNQTLLLAISMLGIAAIMGAGGLGQIMFQALGNQNVAQGAAAGLAFFLVAVVLDRISQRDDADGGNFLDRLHRAWSNRKTPENLIPAAPTPEEEAEVEQAGDVFEPLSKAERLPGAVATIGAIVALVSVFLPWSTDAGKYSAFGRRLDESLPGESFNGLAASGGSWFGIIVAALALFMLAGVFKVARFPGRNPRWLTTDGVALGAVAGLGIMLAYVVGSAPAAVSQGSGIGVWLCLVGFAVATVGALMWLRIAPHGPLHPLQFTIGWGRILASAVVLGMLVISGFSGWSFDARTDVVITPEVQAQIDDLRQQGIDRPLDAAVIANQIANLTSSARNSETIVVDGFNKSGTELGLPLIALGLAALLSTVLAAAVLRASEQMQWLFSTIAAGLGVAIAGIAAAWVGTTSRVADPNFLSGVGALFALVAGAFVVASSMSVLKEFRRDRVYDDIDLSDITSSQSVDARVPAEAMS